MLNLGVAIPNFSGSHGGHVTPAAAFPAVWPSSQTLEKQRPFQPSRSSPKFVAAARSSLLNSLRVRYVTCPFPLCRDSPPPLLGPADH